MGTAQHPRQSIIQPSDWSITELPGLSVENQNQLMACGIHTTLQLLDRVKTIPDRQALAAQLQVHIQHVNKWSALADLARVPAVGCQYCGLLLHSGVSSPLQLGQMSLPRLHQQIMKLQVTTLQRPDLCPSMEELVLWIQQARRIGPLAS